jgi:hypothetical protein
VGSFASAVVYICVAFKAFRDKEKRFELITDDFKSLLFSIRDNLVYRLLYRLDRWTFEASNSINLELRGAQERVKSWRIMRSNKYLYLEQVSSASLPRYLCFLSIAKQ